MNAAATQKLPPKVTFTKYWQDNGLQTDFDKAEQMLMGACQLAHPDPSAPLALTTDASDKAVGGSSNNIAVDAGDRWDSGQDT